MNVGTIRDRVGVVLEHAPNNETWRTHFLHDLNREHAALLLGNAWKFRYRTWRFRTTPDLAFGYADWDFLFGSSRLIKVTDFSGATAIATARNAQNANWTTWGLAGAIITPPTTITGDITNNGYGASEFVIEYAEFAQPVGLLVYPDPRWEVAGGKTTDHTGDWSIQVRRYPLPKDLHQIDSVWLVDSSGVRTLLVPWGRAEENDQGVQVDPTATGTPSTFALDAPGASLAFADSPFYSGTHAPNRISQDRIPAPVRGPVAAVGSGKVGSLPRGVRIQYCYTWFYAGLESGPSPVCEITLAPADDQLVEITNMEVYSVEDIGRKKRLYRRFGEGRWQLVDIVANADGGDYEDDGSVSTDPAYFPADAINDARHLTSAPQQHFLKLYPRPDDFLDIEVRYLAAPRKLESDQDEPEIPGGDYFHEILVHLVAARRLGQMGQPDLARLQQGYAKGLLAILASTELTTMSTPLTKGGRRVSGIGGPPFVTGPIRFNP